MNGSLIDVRGFAAWATDVAFSAVLPAHCASCGKSVDAPGRLCGRCWQAVSFIGAPHCACCGIPFELPQDGAALCGPCMDNPPAFGRARAVFMYEGVGRDMVLAFKMADRTWLTRALADWLVRAGSTLLGEADVIVPVPLQRLRGSPAYPYRLTCCSACGIRLRSRVSAHRSGARMCGARFVSGRGGRTSLPGSGCCCLMTC